mgnify:CR=1 FL=1
MKVTMEKLGITASYSRPRVSNDNPFSEALFRTCKYRPNWPAKGFASHGETWSYAIALRLAEFNLLRQEGGSDPVLILDDVFAELDAKRRKQLVHLAAEAEQVLITAAVDEDLPGNLEPIVRYRVSVEDTETGRISKLSAEEGEGNE